MCTKFMVMAAESKILRAFLSTAPTVIRLFTIYSVFVQFTWGGDREGKISSYLI